MHHTAITRDLPTTTIKDLEQTTRPEPQSNECANVIPIDLKRVSLAVLDGTQHSVEVSTLDREHRTAVIDSPDSGSSGSLGYQGDFPKIVARACIAATGRNDGPRPT
eukprot:1531853-Amphidinium_carterae.1